jgi:sugar/nucleoside kinase (ribokinase family)
MLIIIFIFGRGCDARKMLSHEGPNCFQVHYVLGGVARNIAECMSKLGTKPYMISALGNDMAGNYTTSVFLFLVMHG